MVDSHELTGCMFVEFEKADIFSNLSDFDGPYFSSMPTRHSKYCIYAVLRHIEPLGAAGGSK